MLCSIDSKISKEEVEALVSCMDTNGDGQVGVCMHVCVTLRLVVVCCVDRDGVRHGALRTHTEIKYID